MADVYYDPTATGTDAGTGWTNAYPLLQSALTGAGAGGRVFSRNSNSGNEETYTAGTTRTLTSLGTQYSKTLVIAVKNATTAEPPTNSDIVVDKDDSDVAIYDNTTGGAGDISFVGHVYFWGCSFKAGGDIQIITTGTFTIFEECIIEWGISSTGARYLQTLVSENRANFIDTRLATMGIGDYLKVDNGAVMLFERCVTTGTGNSTNFVVSTTNHGHISFSDCDLSSLTSNTHAFSAGAEGVTGLLQHCKMWSGWSLVSGTVGDLSFYEAVQCSSASDHASPIIAYRSEHPMGSTVEETTVVRSGGGGDGDTNFSYKLTPGANFPTEGIVPMYSPWMAVRVKTGDTDIEAYVHNTGSDKDNDEVWLEVLSPNETAAASNAVRKRQSTRVGLLATPAALTDDATTWNASANYSQKVSLSIAPDTDGIAHVRVAYAMRHATPDPLYVHPTPVVT